MENKERTPRQIKNFKKLIIFFSIFIPIAIALLFEIRIGGVDLSFLPSIYSTINGITALILIAGVIAIKNKRRRLHQNLMQTALILSLLFLVLYILYHITSEEAKYGGDYKTFYLIILASHIILSIGFVPLVLITYFQAWKSDFKRHRKWAHITFPIWLYVAVTGVIVFFMISPYY